MSYPFIVYLKNRTSRQFEYKSDVSSVVRTGKNYRITFGNGRSYTYGANRVRYYPFVSKRENVRIYENGRLHKRYDTVDNYGSYLIFRGGEYRSYPVENTDRIEICDTKKNIRQTESVINYFKKVLKESNGVSFDIPAEEIDGKTPNQISAEILLKALDGIDKLDSRSALSKYIDGINPVTAPPSETLIYPFGCNASQKRAVDTSLRNSISIVEGPPGTGKTQTILNIIANLIVQNKSIAIVSNNNSAVFNVRDKLARNGYEMVVALLGNNANKTSFFDNLGAQTIPPDFEVSEEQLTKTKDEISNLDSLLTTSFEYRNQLASLKTKLSDAKIEFSHIRAEQPLHQEIKSIFDKKFHSHWTPHKALKLKNLLSNIDLGTSLSIINKLRLVFQYGLFDLHSVRRYSEELPVYLNHKFYELHIAKLKSEISDTETWLATNNEENNLKRFVELSRKAFNAVLFEKYKRLGNVKFTIGDYLWQFPEFIARYPVILSSTLSLHTSIPEGYQFDYLIIDEASQVDIIKSAACFSCCRKAIIVGDTMQLTHIVNQESQAVAAQFHDSYQISPAYDYVKNNIMDSLKSLYKDNIQSVLLREHYRCHPAIIGFCNKKYYNNNLVVMTSGDNHPFRIIETTISGGKDNYNQRQIDETDFYIRDNYTDCTKIGVIAPYRSHANKLQRKLPPGTEADTIHKFQGREKEVIIFNTVKNKISSFIDNPNLINVAVSRAVKEFIVVKPESMDLPHGTHIGDLIRYIYYTTDPAETTIPGRIRSVFDLLYKEYNQAFISFISSNKNIQGSPAEMIVYKLLSERILLNNARFSSIDFVREYRLSDLVRDFQPFSQDEIRFIMRNSRIDFLLYNKIDKTPVLAIEVDGVSFHDHVLQRERDQKKDYILKAIGLPLLRLSTDGHNEEARIVKKLKEVMGTS